MTEIFYTYGAAGSDEFIRRVLHRYYNIPNAEICKTINGKPYLKNGKIQFNLTHSKGLTALAVGKTQLGLDCESRTGKPRPAVLKRFTAREQSEIAATSDFYAHWTARESYIKYLGETLASCWRKVEYYRGRIYFRGAEADVKITQFEAENFIFSLCAKETKYTLRRIEP